MEASEKPIKVILAKIGLDGHDRGVKVLARALQDAGMEVEYMGMRVTPEQVAEKAEQDSVDVIGISLLSGAHMKLMPKLVDEVKKRELLGETMILVGGIIPDADIDKLKAMDVDGVFPAGSMLKDITRFIKENRRSQS